MRMEKSLGGLLRALPSVIRMEEAKGLVKTVVNQWGRLGNTAKIAWKILVGGQGIISNLKDFRGFKVGRVIPNLFLGMWETFADREALIDGEKRCTYMEMQARVLKLANALQSLGIKPKDAVASMLYNSSEFLEVFYSLSLIGATMPFVNWHLKSEELQNTINLRRPKILVFDADFLDEILKIKDGLEYTEHLVMVGGSSPAPEGVISYEELIERAPERMPEVNFMVALNPYTAGTTGIPKSSNYYDSFGYMLSDLAEAPRVPFERFLEYSAREFSFLYYYGGVEISDHVGKNIRSLVVTPMYHAGTIVAWAPCMLLGATGVLMRKFDPEEFLRLIEAERISWTFVAPTILQRVLALPEEVKKKYYLGSMHSLICAAAPCPTQVKRDINDLFARQGAGGPVFSEYYGSAETAIVTILLPQDYKDNPGRIESVGKARCGDLKIYMEEEGRWARPGEMGKVMSRTVSTLSLRYPGSEERLHESIKTINGEEWFDDGLLGYLDDDGFLFLTGRVKEMIISGGVNIYPQEIEEVILSHPAVFDVAVVRLPHPDLGEAPIACVQLREGMDADEEIILSFCRQERLRGFKLPAKVEFFEELPRHIDGKIIKRELEERYWEGIERKG